MNVEVVELAPGVGVLVGILGVFRTLFSKKMAAVLKKSYR
jgi:hypothetical protein